MRAVAVRHFVKAYEELHVSEVPDPVPGSDEVLVAVAHAGLNFVDLLYCRGKHQNNRSLVKPPFILGLEFSGTVLSCPASSHLRPGDRVFGGALGAFAERIAVKESSLIKLPEAWSLREAAAMAATAPVSYGALVRIAKLQARETVLVHAAAGGLGIMAVQIAQALGAKVIATVGSREKQRIVKGLGVETVIVYEDEDWEALVVAATGGRGVDVTFDPVGLVEKSIRCSSYAGRIIVVGFAGREGNLEKVATNRILLKSITLHGYRYGEHGRQYPEENRALWDGLQLLVEEKRVQPILFDQPFVGLESVTTAMNAMARRKVWGKAVIDVEQPKGKNPKL